MKAERERKWKAERAKDLEHEIQMKRRKDKCFVD